MKKCGGDVRPICVVIGAYTHVRTVSPLAAEKGNFPVDWAVANTDASILVV
jgi:hypothetical protein